MDCLFCKIIKGEIPSYTVYEDEDYKCFLDINPTQNGDCLVVPKKHFHDTFDIDEEHVLKMNEVAKKVMELLKDKLGASGFQLIQNQGNMQEIKHIHLHVTPHYLKKQEKLSVEEVYNKIK